MILQNSIGKLDLFKDENYFQEQLLNVSLLKFVVIFYIYIYCNIKLRGIDQ